jgi:hypothetical protein
MHKATGKRKEQLSNKRRVDGSGGMGFSTLIKNMTSVTLPAAILSGYHKKPAWSPGMDILNISEIVGPPKFIFASWTFPCRSMRMIENS